MRERTTPAQMVKVFLASYMKLTTNEFNDFMSGKIELTDDMAGGLSGIFGNTKQFWINLAASSKERRE